MADFQAIKEQVSIEEVAQWLGLELQKKGHQFRSPCPACLSGGDRAIVLTPEKQLFYCFSQGIGGDLVTLTGHIKKVSLAEAGQQIAGAFGVGNSRTSAPVNSAPVPQKTSSPSPTFDPENFAKKLDYNVPGLPDAQDFKIGLYRGLLYFPVFEGNELKGWAGIPPDTKLKLPQVWLPSKVVPLRRA